MDFVNGGGGGRKSLNVLKVEVKVILRNTAVTIVELDRTLSVEEISKTISSLQRL